MNDFVGKALAKLEKLSEEQVEWVFNNIIEQNDSFDCVLESLSCGLIIVDSNWHLMKINTAARFFVDIDQGGAKDLCIWNLIKNEEMCSFLKVLAQKKYTHDSREFSVVHGDKTLFLVVSVVPFVRKSNIDGSIITIEDVTSKRQQEILSHRMENLSSLTKLAASVAHEIKNPLGAISIHIQLIQKAIKKKRETDGMLPDEKFLEKYLDVVNEEISELNSTVMDFLFAVRPIQANFILDDPDDIIEKTTDFLKYDFSQSNISFKLDLEKKNQKLMIDPKLLRDVLINLLQNAKAAILSCEDGRNGVLVLKTFEKDNHFVITVADNGCGMTNDQCSKIFEPYYTTKADGTGLGLTTVYKIIKEFKGDINVQSELNKGTIFTISIPVPQKETKLLEEKAN